MEPVMYVSPRGGGSGTRNDPAEFAIALEWANNELTHHSVHIVLLAGMYTDTYRMDRVGNPDHSLIIETDSEAAILQSLSNREDVNAGTLGLSQCQNVILRRLHFRQDPNPQRARSNHFGIRDSVNILVEECTWMDLEVAIEAAAVFRASSRIVFSRCQFERIWGERPGRTANHMLYIAKTPPIDDGTQPPSDVHVVNCNFTDNFGGSYVKMDQGVRNSSVIGCTFVATGLRSHGYRSQGGDGTTATKFIQIDGNHLPLCENITVIENFFTNISMSTVWAIWRPGPNPTGVFQPNVMIGPGEQMHG